MTDICGDIESLQRIVRKTGWQRISIDGIDGAGQAQAAEALAEELGFPVLDINDYLYRNQGGFVDFIDYAALNAAMATMPAYILSGVCMQEILSRVQTEVDGHIYIKRMQQGFWVDEEQCVFPDGVDAAIQTLSENFAAISRFMDEPVERMIEGGDEEAAMLTPEVMRYHDSYQPQETADLLFEREMPPT